MLLDCGPGVLGRLRTRRRGRDLDAIVITHFHLDHWGDLVPWVWGSLFSTGHGDEPHPPELWVPPGGRARLEQFGGLLGFSDMFERVFSFAEYTPDAPFTAGPCTVTATVVPHYRVESHALRVTSGGRTLAYSGDSGPSAASSAIAATPISFSARRPSRGRSRRRATRPSLARRGARRIRASGAKELLITHRPSELEMPDELDYARDGLVGLCESMLARMANAPVELVERVPLFWVSTSVS